MQLSVRDAARLLNASERAIYRWVKDRGLPCTKVQEQMRFNRVELLEWATRHGIPVWPEPFRAAPGEETAPTLAEALEAGGVHHGIPGADAPQAIRALVSALSLPPDVDREFVCAALTARGNAGSTGIGGGIAIPHVRNPVVLPVKSAQVALGFLKKPVDFAAVDGKPVFAFFALLAPTVRTHMHLLARLACVLREESVRRAVERQATSQEILDAVRAAERKLGSAQEGGAARAPSPE